MFEGTYRNWEDMVILRRLSREICVYRWWWWWWGILLSCPYHWLQKGSSQPFYWKKITWCGIIDCFQSLKGNMVWPTGVAQLRPWPSIYLCFKRTTCLWLNPSSCCASGSFQVFHWDFFLGWVFSGLAISSIEFTALGLQTLCLYSTQWAPVSSTVFRVMVIAQ